MNRCIPSTWNSLHRILQRGWKAVSPGYWFELAFSCSFRSPHYPLNKVFVFMWHWGKPPPTELFHNPLGKFALCYCHTKVVVKVGPEVLQQVSSSLPFLSGSSLLNSGFPETAYFAPRPTAHDEHRAHIKYRGELDHMTILHISITSALHQHYIIDFYTIRTTKNKYARMLFPDWKVWVCKLPSPCISRGTQVCHHILNTQMAWCVVYMQETELVFTVYPGTWCGGPST